MDSTEWNQRYAGQDLVWGGEPNTFVADVFGDLVPGRILNVAAGEGRNAIWLAGRGWRVTAIDFSAVAVDKGRRVADKRDLRIDWLVADVRDYEPKEAFDAVLVCYLHIAPDDRRVVLAQAANAVAPGGMILVVGHDLANLADGIGGPQDPAVLYTPEGISAELPGLVIRRAQRVYRQVQTEHGVRQALDTLVIGTAPKH